MNFAIESTNLKHEDTLTMNNSTKTINGRTYTHRFNNDVCRILCADFAGAINNTVVAVLQPSEHEAVGLADYEQLKPGADPAFDVDWSTVPTDTPIWVRDSDDAEWVRRHFACFANGYVHAWSDGRTSHSTSDHEVTSWRYATTVNPEQDPIE